MDIHIIDEEGVLQTHRLGDSSLQLVVPADRWFAAEPIPGSSYCLVACAVAPAFVYERFELANCQSLQSQFPQHSSLICRLSR